MYSLFATVPPVAMSGNLLEGPRVGPDLSAFFIDTNAEDTNIVKQTFGTISKLGSSLTEDISFA